MLKNENIICISSIDWDFNWQGHQEIMTQYAKNGNRVLFIENTGIRKPSFKDIPRLKKRFVNWFRSIKGFREEFKNLYIYSPLILPFPYSKFAQWINKYLLILPLKRWIKSIEFYDPIVWTFLPTRITLDIINSVDKKLLVYYCIADFYELAGGPKKVKKTENELIRKSDLIFVQGNVLKEKCRHLNDNVYVFPFGVKIETFENFQQISGEVPADIRGIKRPIIGYIGGIHRHINFGLVRFIAEIHPEWSLALIGPIQTNTSEISNLDNVFLLGKKDFSCLPNYINQFDVGIVPYNMSGYTATVFPTKLNEYHAMGKPAVSTELPEIASFNAKNDNLVFVGKTHKEFVDCISIALKSQSDELVNLRKASARRNSWTARVEKMSNLIEDALEKKAERPLDWKERFLKFYKVTKRKVLSAAIAVLSAYLILFYTPLVWFVAHPLKISQVPEKADCIVVFAGGVGESGKAGQGYEERVQHAVELYNKGYAQYMIFSSGYMYAFKEPLVMKALALFLGVPEKAIIIEDKATNTFQNVKFVKEILEQHTLDEIILVSSLYHMRRASLVFNKIAPETKIIYSPVPHGRFYRHGIGRDGRRKLKQISWRQIKGIVHEYLGIVYYWRKGYI